MMKLYLRGPSNIKELCIEICLIAPARLSCLLPYIPTLMTAVLVALRASDEQVPYIIFILFYFIFAIDLKACI